MLRHWNYVELMHLENSKSKHCMSDPSDAIYKILWQRQILRWVHVTECRFRRWFNEVLIGRWWRKCNYTHNQVNQPSTPSDWVALVYVLTIIKLDIVVSSYEIHMTYWRCTGCTLVIFFSILALIPSSHYRTIHREATPTFQFNYNPQLIYFYATVGSPRWSLRGKSAVSSSLAWPDRFFSATALPRETTVSLWKFRCSGWHILSSSFKGQDLHQGAVT